MEGRSFLGVGLALGLSVGVAVGVATGNLAVGIALGMALGVAFGAIADASNRRKAGAREGGDAGAATLTSADGGERSKVDAGHDADGSDGGGDGGGGGD